MFLFKYRKTVRQNFKIQNVNYEIILNFFAIIIFIHLAQLKIINIFKNLDFYYVLLILSKVFQNIDRLKSIGENPLISRISN